MSDIDRPAELSRIIVLNGASGAGKTTTARALIGSLDEAWISMSIDDLNARLRETLRIQGATEVPEMRRRLVLGYHRMVLGYVSVGNLVVMDHVLGEEWRLRDLLDVFSEVPTLLVGVRCPLDDLLHRASARGANRGPLVAQQHVLAHAHGVYDIEVDTGQLTPIECAEAIRTRLRSAPTALAALRDAAGQ